MPLNSVVTSISDVDVLNDNYICLQISVNTKQPMQINTQAHTHTCSDDVHVHVILHSYIHLYKLMSHKGFDCLKSSPLVSY